MRAPLQAMCNCLHQAPCISFQESSFSGAFKRITDFFAKSGKVIRCPRVEPIQSHACNGTFIIANKGCLIFRSNTHTFCRLIYVRLYDVLADFIHAAYKPLFMRRTVKMDKR